MKKILFLFAMLPFALAAQTSKTVTLHCKKFVNSAAFDSLTLFELDGMGARVVTRAGRTADSSYIFKVPAGKPKIYGMGVSEYAFAKVVLGEEPEVSMWGDCAKITFSRATGKANDAYRQMAKRLEAIYATDEEIKYAFIAARVERDDKASNATLERLKKHDKAKKQYLDSLRSANAFYGHIASLFITPSYELAKKEKYGSEEEFYAKEFFQNADLKNAVFNEAPDMAEAFRRYATVVAAMNIPADAQRSLSEQMLASLTPDSKAYKFALAGLITGFQSANNPNYAHFAERYIREYKGRDRGEVRRLDQEMMRTRTSTPGAEAPDLEGDTPEGGKLTLYSMRGKVVLVDFWASWCGPCIREMPTVKAAYDKYKDKGFDILGVSLDSQKANWVNKINELVMPWKHMSDLKGWQSEHAKIYSVTSIPQTILLDKDGRIIQRNLRGEALIAKLDEIFAGK